MNILRRYGFKALAGLVMLAPPGCDRATLDETYSAVRYDADVRTYFPSAFADSILASAFVGTFHFMHEPSLATAHIAGGAIVRRFLWIPSFRPSVSVRIEQRDARCIVITTVLGLGTTEWTPADADGILYPLSTHPGAILRRDPAVVSLATCRAATSGMDSAIYSLRNVAELAPGSDGAEWLFEFRDSREHLASSLWSPDSAKLPEIWNAGLHALLLSHALTPGEHIFELHTRKHPGTKPIPDTRRYPGTNQFPAFVTRLAHRKRRLEKTPCVRLLHPRNLLRTYASSSLTERA